MEHEAYVGDDSEHLAFVALEQGNGVVVIGCHQYLGAGPLSEDLLLFVEGILEGGDILLENQLVQQGKIGGVVSH